MARPHASYGTARRPDALQRAWICMRIQRQFTQGSIQAAAEVGTTNLRKWLAALVAAGYVRVVRDNRSGAAGSYRVYALVRDSGPMRPLRRADGSVYDQNTKAVSEPQGANEHAA